MSGTATHDDLVIELELISSSLLPVETLTASGSEIWPRTVDINSEESKLSIHIIINEGYRSKDAVSIEIKSSSMGRDEATHWKNEVNDKMGDWNEDDEYPLFQILTTHFLPLLAASSPIKNTVTAEKTSITTDLKDNQLYHCLLISHHLLSSTKRKNLISLSSELSLIGFSKVGHPGIMYSIGRLKDLEEWIREVKSWNWLALKVRITPEPINEDLGKNKGKGGENGARGGKGRGEWKELEKINEALDWLKSREKGREQILIDFGVGGSGAIEK
ncbi:uncharacterized protein L201_003624 [Kwoniella dendrophila CBS 6074]|uniref:Uncharacterized protein n=1 Tax=Kwoniella dendrophila CBS 6074 TaxID=1295534 RepID=A0AAX4JTH6_9TREE